MTENEEKQLIEDALTCHLDGEFRYDVDYT